MTALFRQRIFSNSQQNLWPLLGMLLAAIISLTGGLGIETCEAEEQLPNLRKTRPASFERPFLIEFKGEINWQLAKYFRAKIEQAKSAGADLILVDIDSPGGLKSESLSIAEMLRDIDWAYTVAFVPREALSGAALITYGFDELVIGKFARIGDIGIIQYDPQLFAFRFAEEKIQSVLISQARDLAQSKGRSPELAEAMINKDYVIYQREVGGKTEFKGIISEKEDAPGQDWTLVSESKKGFLTVNGVRAEELGLAQHFAADRNELTAEFGLDQNEINVLKHTSTDTVVYYLNHPFATGLLILVGLVALFSELSAPGIGVGGLTAALCAALFFWSRFLGGTSTWLEVVLFGAGIVFLLMEFFVIPGWGVSGIMGLMLLVASVFMASQDFVVPSNGRQWNQFLTSSLVMMCAGALFCIAAAVIIRNIGHIPIFSKLVLAPPVEETENLTPDKKQLMTEHPSISIGDWGRSESLLRPAGRAIFAGQSFDVVSDGEFIDPGTQIRVVTIQGNRIVVSAIESDSDASSV